MQYTIGEPILSQWQALVLDKFGHFQTVNGDTRHLAIAQGDICHLWVIQSTHCHLFPIPNPLCYKRFRDKCYCVSIRVNFHLFHLHVDQCKCMLLANIKQDKAVLTCSQNASNLHILYIPGICFKTYLIFLQFGDTTMSTYSGSYRCVEACYDTTIKNMITPVCQISNLYLVKTRTSMYDIKW